MILHSLMIMYDIGFNSSCHMLFCLSLWVGRSMGYEPYHDPGCVRKEYVDQESQGEYV